MLDELPGLAATNHLIVVISPLQCAGLNRHEVEDERALRERSSDPLGPESCGAVREGGVEA